MKNIIILHNALFHLICCASVFLCIGGCKKFISVGPPKTQVVTASVFSNDASAKSAIDGIYSQMVNTSGFTNGGVTSVSVLAGLSSDELVNYSASGDQSAFYSNSLTPTNSNVLNGIWKPAYQYIYDANAIIEGLENADGVSVQTKIELTGEAKFIRAFCHFYLVNLFGDVPLVLSTDYRINNIISRTSKELVYHQIISDLIDAQTMLKSDYSFSAGERIRPNKWAATALLARAYLYTNDWKNAETLASSIIDNNTNFSLPSDLNKVFLKNSTEAIWQLKPVVPGYNTNEGSNFILTATPSSQALSPSLLIVFEDGDRRKTSWVDSLKIGVKTFYFPVKYKIKATGQALSEYSMVLRLAEQYLIRAEARLNLGNNTGAASDINIIRGRAGLSNTTANDKSSLVAAIQKERQAELFSEWGHRWLDLKRTGSADQVLSSVKGANWQSTDLFYPVPQTEINSNPGLSQNAGY